MKYFHGQLEERNGEQEYTHDYLIKAKSLKEAEQRLILEASTFYGSDPTPADGDGNIFEFFGGAISVEANCIGQTTKAQFHKNMEARMLLIT